VEKGKIHKPRGIELRLLLCAETIVWYNTAGESARMMEAAYSSETPATIDEIRWCHTPKDSKSKSYPRNRPWRPIGL
jgi:hypothetical protein